MKGFTESRSIKWQNVLSNFDGYTSQFLYRTFQNLLELAKNRIESSEFIGNHQINN